ncbi:MAG TPA: efflux RND transporter periplasmic adaptor subunit, partial [Steroidobacteraceae bacterium]|nr:efflux RND transporter periplasmic adaptor subunit [Steroidobacteraceae bacterium]
MSLVTTNHGTILAVVLSALALLGGCSKSDPPADEHGHGEEQAEHEEFERGPHGGRMLEDGDFAIELAIFESGVPPEFRAWATRGGKPLEPSQVQLAVQLERFGGVAQRIEFAPQQDFLRSTSEVSEPHSFAVAVEATSHGATHRWQYESFEGRTQIVASAAKEAGVVIETAGPRTIDDVLPLYGVIATNPESVRAVSARYPGAIRTVVKSLGDVVKRGEVLATIESNESLQTYSVTAPIGGVITNRHANPGEVADDDPLFVVTDLSNVTADLSVFARDLARVRLGQRARIRSVDRNVESEGRVVYVSPAGAGANQALIVRVKLDNAERRWTPGVYINAELLVGGKEVPVAVRADALQRFRDWQVVFQNEGDAYQAQPVETGRSDGEWVEISSGLPAG